MLYIIQNFIYYIIFIIKNIKLSGYTPLKIYNGTPEGRPTRDSRATLPINELKGNPP